MKRSIEGRTFWTILDQALSMVSNGVIGVAAANLLTIRQVGLLAIAVSIYGVLLLFVRAILLNPYLIEMGRGGDQGVDLLQRRAFIFGLGVAALVGGGSLFWEGEGGRILLTLSAVLPFLCLQDAARYTSLVSPTPKRAAAMDGLWVVGALIVWLSFSVGWAQPAPVTLLMGWAACGAISSVLLVNPTRLVGPVDGQGWKHQVVSTSGPLLIELLLGSVLVLAIPVELSILSSIDEAGLYRTVMTLQGPLSALAAGLVLANRPSAARLMMERSPLVGRMVARVALTMVGVSVLWTLGAVSLPAQIGSRVFGEAWTGMDGLFLPAGLQFIAGLLTAPLSMMLTSEVGFGKEYLRLRLIAGVVLLAAVGIGAVQAGAYGALIGQGLANLLLSWLSYRVFRKRLNRVGPKRTAELPRPSSNYLES